MRRANVSPPCTSEDAREHGSCGPAGSVTVTESTSQAVAYSASYSERVSCGGWLPWRICQKTRYKTAYHTVQLKVTKEIPSCCDGYEQVGSYCALPLNRSEEFTSKPGLCPEEDEGGSILSCEWDTDCPGLQRCCPADSGSQCRSPLAAAGERGWYVNVTITVKMDYQELHSQERGLLNHTRLLHSVVTGAVESPALSVHHVHSYSPSPFLTASQLLVGAGGPISVRDLAARLQLIVQRIEEVSAVDVRDVDECAHEELYSCPPAAYCLNTEGSYNCSCHEGLTDSSPNGTVTACLETPDRPSPFTASSPPGGISLSSAVVPTSTAAGGGSGKSAEALLTTSTQADSVKSTISPRLTPWRTALVCADSAPTLSLPGDPALIKNLVVLNVTGSSFYTRWSVDSPVGRQAYVVQLFRGTQSLSRAETELLSWEATRLDPGVLYTVRVTSRACGQEGNATSQDVKTEGKALRGRSRLTNVQFTEALRNSSSGEYFNLTRDIWMEIRKSLPPDIQALVESGAVRILITRLSSGSVMVDFLVLFSPDLAQNMTAVSTAILDSLKSSSRYDVDSNSTGLEDFDECAAGDEDCSPHAVCENTWGSFSCACRSAFTDTDPARPGRSCEDGSAGLTTEDTVAGPKEMSVQVRVSSSNKNPLTVQIQGRSGKSTDLLPNPLVPRGLSAPGFNDTDPSQPGRHCAGAVQYPRNTAFGQGSSLTMLHCLIALGNDWNVNLEPPTTAAVQANTVGGYSCACRPGFADADPSQPGRLCAGTAPTTRTFLLSVVHRQIDSSCDHHFYKQIPEFLAVVTCEIIFSPFQSCYCYRVLLTFYSTFLKPYTFLFDLLSLTYSVILLLFHLENHEWQGLPHLPTSHGNKTGFLVWNVSVTCPTESVSVSFTPLFIFLLATHKGSSTALPSFETPWLKIWSSAFSICLEMCISISETSKTPTAAAPPLPHTNPTSWALVDVDNAITVDCRLYEISVTVAKAFLAWKSIAESSLFLGVTECGLSSTNETHVKLTAMWDNCDTKLLHNRTHTTAWTTLLNNRTVDSSIAPRVYIEIPVKCTYSNSLLISTGYTPTGVDMIKDIIEGSGIFLATIQLLNGTSPLPKNYSLSPDDEVFIEVGINLTMTQVKLILNECWATPTSSPSDPTTHMFMKNSCPIPNTYTTVIENGNSTKARLSLRIFSFVDHSVIYLHCQVQICIETAGTSCKPHCEQRSERSIKAVEIGQASWGPIYRSSHAVTKETLNSHRETGFIVLGVLLCLLLLVTLTVVALFYRKRIGHYNFSFKPNQENFTYHVFDT
ncbi:UROL1 protein, partial [Atractosteus spatula]|nr:UROL1 protein [Atractosteus spatula]